MTPLSVALLVLASLGTAYYILSTVALAAHFRRKCKSVAGQWSVSLLKPVSGLDAEASHNFSTFLRQDYANYETLFGVLDSDDSSVPVIKNATAGLAHASFYVASELEGANNKVRILYNLVKHANGEILIVTDADTRVTPDFIYHITAPFADETVGAVTCMYRGIEAKSFADKLEGLHMSCAFAPGVASANALSGIDFGLGAAIAVRKKTLEDIGGFKSIVDYLADDYQLGKRTALAGYKVLLSSYVMDIALSHESLRSVLAREVRWARTTRVSRPWGQFGYVITYGFAWAVLFWLSTLLSLTGWGVLGGVAVIRIITAYIGAYKYLGDREFSGRVYLLPLRDLLSFGIWIASYFSSKVKWRGRTLRVLRDGRMEEVEF